MAWVWAFEKSTRSWMRFMEKQRTWGMVMWDIEVLEEWEVLKTDGGFRGIEWEEQLPELKDRKMQEIEATRMDEETRVWRWR